MPGPTAHNDLFISLGPPLLPETAISLNNSKLGLCQGPQQKIFLFFSLGPIPPPSSKTAISLNNSKLGLCQGPTAHSGLFFSLDLHCFPKQHSFIKVWAIQGPTAHNDLFVSFGPPLLP
jgi:hypothetical protein